MDPTEAGQSRTLLQVRVGTFILAALLVFVGLVYFLGRQAGLFERQYRLLASFAQIGGLIEGATVRLAGVPVGRVTAIRLPDAGGAKVQVELTLVRRVQSRVRADSVARIETLGLLGDKIVELSLGSATAAVLPEWGMLRTEDPLDTNRLTMQGTVLLRNLVDLSADLKRTLGALGESTAGPDLVETIRAVRRLTTELERGQGVLHGLLYDARLGTALTEAVTGLRQIGAAARRLESLLGDPKTAGLMADAGVTVAEARAVIERVGRLAREVEEGKGLLHQLVYGESRLIQDLDRLLARADTVVASVERGEGALGVLLRDPDATRAVRRVVAAAEGLAQAVDRARDADGLLQALLYEPRGKAIVADLADTARHFREVTGRVAGGSGVLGGLTRSGPEAAVEQAAQGLQSLGRLATEVAGDARLAETLADLRAAMANLKAITARVESGEGTLGGLVSDPTVYENLAAFLEGAQRSLILRALIRAAIGRGGGGR